MFEEYLDDIRLKITPDFDDPFINLWHKKYEHIKICRQTVKLLIEKNRFFTKKPVKPRLFMAGM